MGNKARRWIGQEQYVYDYERPLWMVRPEDSGRQFKIYRLRDDGAVFFAGGDVEKDQKAQRLTIEMVEKSFAVFLESSDTEEPISEEEFRAFVEDERARDRGTYYVEEEEGGVTIWLKQKQRPN